MKLILKQIPDKIDVSTVDDVQPRIIPGKAAAHALFALFTEAGDMLPCQVSTALRSEADGGMPKLTVTFNVDGTNVVVEGHGL